MEIDRGVDENGREEPCAVPHRDTARDSPQEERFGSGLRLEIECLDELFAGGEARGLWGVDMLVTGDSGRDLRDVRYVWNI